jgi:hypothetical protein
MRARLQRQPPALPPGSGAVLERLSMAGALGIGVAIATAQIAGRIPEAIDARVYYHAQLGDLYLDRWDDAVGVGAYLYSPAFAQVLEPLRLLPELVFNGLWQLMLVAVLVVGLRGWALPILLAAVPFLIAGVAQVGAYLAASDIAHGNIHVLLGAVALFGIRYPAAWSFALLSKLTPGIGLVWFAARREWRNLGLALGATAAIAAISFTLSPGDWLSWARFLLENQGQTFPYWVVPIALPIRLAMSAALLWWGGRTDRPWVVPIAVGWAIPAPYLTMLTVMVFALPAWRNHIGRARLQAARPASGGDPAQLAAGTSRGRMEQTPSSYIAIGADSRR